MGKWILDLYGWVTVILLFFHRKSTQKIKILEFTVPKILVAIPNILTDERTSR